MIFSMMKMWKIWLKSILGKPNKVGEDGDSKEEVSETPLTEEYTQSDSLVVGTVNSASYIFLGKKKGISYYLVKTDFDINLSYIFKIDSFGRVPTEILVLSEGSEEIH